MYYNLQKHCKLVKGAARGAIYDFKTGKVHSINQSAAQLLSACQSNALEDLWDMSSTESTQYMNFLNKLEQKDLGFFHETSSTSLPERSLPDCPAKLEFLWLELTAACNSKCLHCYSESGPSRKELDLVPHHRWLSLIEEAKAAGATDIQFIGGEPLLYPKWRDLVIKAHEIGYEYIEIFTNATLVDDSCIDFFKQYNVNIATTIYANNASVHDSVTLHPNSFTKTMTAIKKILEAKIPLRIASIIMKANEHEVPNILKLYEELGMPDAYPDVIRPTGRGDDQHLLPTTFTKPPIKPPFYTDEASFTASQTYCQCLAGKIAITSTGDVIPCIFARNQVCGNILTHSLADVLTDHPLQQCWHTTKNQIQKCKDCEYRYACTDCRPLAQGNDSNKSWLAPPAACSYNPYTGEW
ncbi:radical SAM protein [Pelosinus baikalensis]|uniref:Radical SAM protein n=1 Tax=Pelosinus baikalensis TaxID=2892015 RepID=A0ABS8HRB7_9FIRM|nr:radical SAM protein [Pelosinus baikalensis]MCC5465610.1 radical SAM protein [Pelosinus baikalensis]